MARSLPEVLVTARACFADLPEAAAWPFERTDWTGMLEWRQRAQAEADQSVLQLIPYLLLHDGQGRYWCYQRTGGDPRLEGARSCGVGGHVDRSDERLEAEATLRQALLREVREELDTDLSEHITDPIAWLYEGNTPVGRVHIGVVYTLQWPWAQPPVPARGEALRALGFLPLTAIAADARFELWSRLAAAYLLENHHA